MRIVSTVTEIRCATERADLYDMMAAVGLHAQEVKQHITTLQPDSLSFPKELATYHTDSMGRDFSVVSNLGLVA